MATIITYRDGGITPCALMLGLLYLQRISALNPKYLTKVPSSDLFLTAMVYDVPTFIM